MDSKQIVHELRRIEARLDELQSKRPKILAMVFAAGDAGEEKAVTKSRGALSDLDLSIDTSTQRKKDLEDSLRRVVSDELEAEIAEVPRTEALIQQELIDAGREIGEALGRAAFLEERFLGGVSYIEWRAKRTPYGAKEPPPEGMAKVFEAIGHSMGATKAKLKDEDPGAETFASRKHTLVDLKRLGQDANMKQYVITKRISALLNEVKG